MLLCENSVSIDYIIDLSELAHIEHNNFILSVFFEPSLEFKKYIIKMTVSMKQGAKTAFDGFKSKIMSLYQRGKEQLGYGEDAAKEEDHTGDEYIFSIIILSKIFERSLSKKICNKHDHSNRLKL